MSLGTGLYDYLTASLPAGVLVEPLRLPDPPPDPVLAVTYRVIDTVGYPTHGGPAAIRTPRIQLDIWAEDHGSAEALASSVRTLLDGFRGSWTGVVVGSCLFDDERDLDEPDTQLWRRSQDYLITYRETP